MTPIHLLVAYGIVFGIQNKAIFLRKKVALLDALLNCTYCLGFHVGWALWLGEALREGGFPGVGGVAWGVASWGFGSAAFCYGLDTVMRWCERAR